MNISIPSILRGLGGKCLLNWALVFLQRNHICKSFLGVFSVSLAVVDTLLTLSVTALHIHADGHLLGLKLTRYHVCLLVQIIGEVYSALQWPVVVVAGLDHFSTITRRLKTTTKWISCLFVNCLLWCLVTLYVFLLSDFRPVMEEVSHNLIHQCWVFHTPQILQVATFLFLTLGCAVLHAVRSTSKNPPLKDQKTEQSSAHARRRVVHQTLNIFGNTWALFLFFLAVVLLLPVGIPAYLGLNIAWLCFLNSLLIAVVLCAVCPASQLAQGLAEVPSDSFCEWRFKFSLAAEERTRPQR
ncbi:putative G-protein coupled receptor 160 [Cottoperca gobio]|uniref:Probable G-protein coupled receptor 160 n=1 Tax=Cottoperca gobio TaxID=56716 RepID=A0A6J2RKA7_COTGO|nr:probable G-protein coupled receptor 160 [Cottoperca gobio]XP_029309795.1 probable G-protein coupled receptor 160 [Cottoperca gobio]XP_029309796.1 probable G-protein coupled receptor 160 [Cottoperca gobio]XP_029309797.1 probable G-protein coupled receptor 160 [Cottoperca gobio]